MGGLALALLLLQFDGAHGSIEAPLRIARPSPPTQDAEGLAPEVSAIVSSLEEADPGADRLQVRLQRAFEAFQVEHDSYRAQGARAIAEAMHRRADATWSAFCLEGILRRMGEYGRAEEVLSSHLSGVVSGQERVDTVVRLAILCAGAGWRARERVFLGQALVLGSVDAYQILGLQALSSGAHDRSRSLFRPLVEASAGAPGPEAPWALRGWGLALLPAAAEPLRRSAR